MRRIVARLVVGSLLVSLASLPAHAAAKTYSWDKDVRPAILGAFCISGAEIRGHYRFWANATGGDDCPVKSTDPALAAVTKAIHESNASIQWLFIAMMEKLSPKDRNADPAGKDAIEAAFHKSVLDDARLVARYMPVVHAALMTANASCADCPGPTAAAATPTVKLDDLMPYAVAYVWPDRINGPSVSLHICMGANGISEMPGADLRLADAAFWGVFGNKGAMKPIEKNFSGPEDFPDAKTDDEKLVLFRKHLHDGLSKDAAFRAAVAKALVENAAKLPVVCSDCGDAAKGGSS